MLSPHFKFWDIRWIRGNTKWLNILKLHSTGTLLSFHRVHIPSFKHVHSLTEVSSGSGTWDMPSFCSSHLPQCCIWGWRPPLSANAPSVVAGSSSPLSAPQSGWNLGIAPFSSLNKYWFHSRSPQSYPGSPPLPSLVLLGRCVWYQRQAADTHCRTLRNYNILWKHQ